MNSHSSHSPEVKCPLCGNVGVPKRKIAVDLDTNTLLYDGHVIVLSPRQAEIMQVLADGYPGAVTRSRIAAAVYGAGSDWEKIDENIISVMVCHLRKRIAGISLKVRTARAKGFYLEIES